MAPAILQAAAGSAAKDFKNESTASRILGSGKHITLDFMTKLIGQGPLASQSLPYSIQYTSNRAGCLAIFTDSSAGRHHCKEAYE